MISSQTKRDKQNSKLQEYIEGGKISKISSIYQNHDIAQKRLKDKKSKELEEKKLEGGQKKKSNRPRSALTNISFITNPKKSEIDLIQYKK